MSEFLKRFPTSLRKRYVKLFPPTVPPPPERDMNPNSVSAKIYEALQADTPCMIGRFGATELNCICNYLSIVKPNLFRYVRGLGYPWWWDGYVQETMKTYSGFFPNLEENLHRFSVLMLRDAPLIDILAAWRPEEKLLKKELTQAYRIELEYLTPFWASSPWTKALEGKKVLVVHPFTQSIEKQYLRRELIHSNPDILPLFELKTLKAVQSLGGECKEDFADWFSALKYMEDEIDKIDYDICIIGCGAYGFPLAAHVKRNGKKAVHLGGATQLLFGIKGKRWENYWEEFDYTKFMNEYWIRPTIEETPTQFQAVEDGCYW